MRRPLDGIKVVDLTTMLAASSCARIFAEWGADVVKVEATGGEMYRTSTKTMGVPITGDANPLFDQENANKTMIALDLKSEAGHAILMKMLEQADILVTNYREKALVKLGIDYATLKEKYPRLIYSWTGGYGTKGPDKDKGGFDYTTFYARTGILQDLTEKGHPPLTTISGFGDHTAGLCQALATIAALYARSVTGVGDRIETSLYQAGLYVTNNGPMIATAGREFPKSRYDQNQITSTTYQCKDGTWLFLAGVKYDQLWPVLCTKVFNRPDLLTDEKWCCAKNMLQHVNEGIHMLDEIFLEHDYAYWEKLLKENDVPFEKCVHFKDVFDDPQAIANEFFTDYEYPTGEKTKLMRAPAKFDSCPELIELKHAGNTVGRDTRAYLKTLGYGDEEINALNASGAIKAV